MLKKLKFLSNKKEHVQQEGPVLWGPGGEMQKQEPTEEVTHMYNIPVSPKAIPGGAMIWTVQSPQGGDGSTTVATNIASLLAVSSPEKVVLIDLDGVGSVRSRMGLPVTHCLVNILDWQDVKDVKDMARAMVAHSSGVMVIPGVVHYDHVSLVTPTLIFNMLTILKDRYEHIILDCPPVSINPTTWASVLVSDVILTVIKPDRTSLDLAKDNISYLKRLGGQDRSCIILNQTGQPGGIRASDLVGNQELGLEIHHMLPHSVSVAEANNRRELMAIAKPRDEFSIALKQLIEKMGGV